MHVDPVWQSQRLFGAGQIVAVADSGLDTGNLATISPDFAGRIVATHVLSAGGDLADQFGHGTHVAGSVVGSGAQSGANPAAHSTPARSPASHPRPNWLSRRLRPGQTARSSACRRMPITTRSSARPTPMAHGSTPIAGATRPGRSAIPRRPTAATRRPREAPTSLSGTTRI